MFVCYAAAMAWSKLGSNLRGAVLLQDNSIMYRFLWKLGDAGAFDNRPSTASIPRTEGSGISSASSTSARHQQIPQSKSYLPRKKQRGLCRVKSSPLEAYCVRRVAPNAPTQPAPLITPPTSV